MIDLLSDYAFSNPDRPAWYGVLRDTDNNEIKIYRLFNDEAKGQELGAHPLIDIHGRFHTWFFFSFIHLLLSCLSINLVYMLSGLYPMKWFGKVLGAIVFPVVGCTGLALWIMGLI